MPALDEGIVFSLFVGLTLVILAATILIAGRRRLESVFLALFLVLVGTNFVAGAMSIATGASYWTFLGYFVLGLDPLFLVLFVCTYPYRRSRGLVRGWIGTLAGGAIVAELLLAFRFQTLFLEPPARGLLLMVTLMGAAYASAWFLSVRAVGSAPTPSLAGRASWMVAAVGVAVLPRLGIIHGELAPELGPALWGELLVDSAVGRPAVVTGVAAALATGLVVALWWAGVLVARPASSAPSMRGALRFALWGSIALVLAGQTVSFLGSAFVINTWGVAPFALRWLFFAGILTSGILRFEVVEFGRAADRVFPTVAGLFGALLVTLITLLYAPRFGSEGTVSALLAAAFAVAAFGVFSGGARVWVRRHAAGAGSTARRLELYLAALETAWAAGVPSGPRRMQLDRDRKAFGVSVEEARALEHTVAMGAGRTGEGLKPGDEPTAGLVIEALIGEGSQGRVFAARRYPEGDRVVVKELRVGGGEPEATRRRLLNEMKPLQGLDHPHIARLLDVKVAGGRYLLVMEFVDGRTLASLLEAGPLGEDACRRILRELLDALAAAHERGVVHLDVKPSNIIVAADGSATLTDFGVARVRDEEGRARGTATSFGSLGEIAGTLSYMAPEQADGAEVGPRTDLYAVGLVAYEMLTGRRARDSRAGPVAVQLARISRPTIDLRRAPEAWQACLLGALAVHPGGRFTSAAAMRDAIPRP